MSTSQRARSGVPLDQRSAFATVPGVPAWGAVAIAGGASFLGFVIDAARGTELTSAFACLYIIGVVAAVVLVRYRALFTAMVQAPLLLFVAVPLSYQYFTDNPGTSPKDILLNVAIPLVNRFPLMLLAAVLALGLGAARVFLKRQASHAPAGAATRSVRDRAKESRERAKSARDKRAKSTETRASESRTSDARTSDSRPSRSRTADPRRTDPRRTEPRSRREDGRRQRVAPQYDRPAADPYRPERIERDSQHQDDQPSRRANPRPQQQPRIPQPRVPRPPEVDPYSAPRAATVSAHIPPHPVPQVRYRDRHEP